MAVTILAMHFLSNIYVI